LHFEFLRLFFAKPENGKEEEKNEGKEEEKERERRALKQKQIGSCGSRQWALQARGGVIKVGACDCESVEKCQPRGLVCCPVKGGAVDAF
jgi:hypothetical protein